MYYGMQNHDGLGAYVLDKHVGHPDRVLGFWFNAVAALLLTGF